MKQILILSVMVLSSGICFAQNASVNIAAPANASSLPINLIADHGEFDANKNVATYTGNVVVTQGEMILKGDKIMITLDKGEVHQIKNWGNLASFHYVPSEDPPVDGKGKYMVYHVNEDTIDIDGNAWVKQEDNETYADHITYHISDERVEGHNVQMTLIPKSKEKL